MSIYNGLPGADGSPEVDSIPITRSTSRPVALSDARIANDHHTAKLFSRPGSNLDLLSRHWRRVTALGICLQRRWTVEGEPFDAGTELEV